jgi:hypothetical protein
MIQTIMDLRLVASQFENTFELDDLSLSAVLNENTESTHHSRQMKVISPALLA